MVLDKIQYFIDLSLFERHIHQLMDSLFEQISARLGTIAGESGVYGIAQAGFEY